MFLTETAGHTGTEVSGAYMQKRWLMNLPSKPLHESVMKLLLAQLKLEQQNLDNGLEQVVPKQK